MNKKEKEVELRNAKKRFEGNMFLLFACWIVSAMVFVFSLNNVIQKEIVFLTGIIWLGIIVFHVFTVENLEDYCELKYRR